VASVKDAPRLIGEEGLLYEEKAAEFDTARRKTQTPNLGGRESYRGYPNRPVFYLSTEQTMSYYAFHVGLSC
jgi:hypothetical protein